MATNNDKVTGISPIEEIISDLSEGKMVIVVDDEGRENEGDFIIPAECVDSAAINYMATHGRGLICLTLTGERCEQLNLPLMVSDTDDSYRTNFTVSIEAAQGVTTGISAADRAQTVKSAVAAEARPTDIVMPGHIFPLKSQSGGVLARAGHTEAGCDLARLAGYEPASVICEILKEDGTMARLPDLITFGEKQGIKIGTIADLIRYRLQHEPTITRIAESTMASQYGNFNLIAYQDVIGNETHYALSFGDFDHDDEVHVRVQLVHGLYDAFCEARGETSWTVHSAMKLIAEEGKGVLVLLCYYFDHDEMVKRIRQSQLKELGRDDSLVVETGSDLRIVGLGGQILKDLNVGKMHVLGTPRKIHALSGFDLEVIDYISDDS